MNLRRVRRVVQFVIFHFLVMILPFIGYSQGYDPKTTDQKLTSALQIIRFAYVDTVNESAIVEKAVIEMLKKLDPHSIYISKDDLEESIEPLEGNFEGIGVQFQIFNDTILVIAPIPGGPSEKLGIIAGDKIVKIEGVSVTGSEVTTTYVQKLLRGKKGTKVKIGVYRKGKHDLIDFTIVRDRVPVNSIVASYMTAPEIGYIKLTRFSRTTMYEFETLVLNLLESGMKNLVLDLRGNSGGYLSTAIELSDEFLGKNKLIVYTEGIASPVKKYFATNRGIFEKGKIVILIDEGSASASEIVAGAIQDWDRGIIVGRRSFGKGLVQRPFPMPDGSLIRLTTARYHTPTGRCIQRPYDNGVEEYYNELVERYLNGEFIHADSIHFPDSLKYFTPHKRLVYGGGGITPDAFVSIDTTHMTNYYSDLRKNEVFNDFALMYLDNYRDSIVQLYPAFEDFNMNFEIDKKFLGLFKGYASLKGVVEENAEPKIVDLFIEFLENNKDTLQEKYSTAEIFASKFPEEKELIDEFMDYVKDHGDHQEEIAYTEEIIKYQIKALLSRNLYGLNSYYQVISEMDDDLQKAIEILEDPDFFKENKIQD
ncbi:S41 family peptidase [Bacteroidota bacterium]